MDYDNKSLTILVVDDTPENISIIGDYLAPYQVKVATNGQKALQIAETYELDLILLDIKMPDMDGYEVCRKLKENPRTKDIPVIFLTVLSETNDIIKGFNLGAVDYITKPFRIEEVKSRIKTHLTLSAYQKLLKISNEELEKKVEERTRELLFAKDRAEEASRLKSYFLSLINHELRTPMTGIAGYTEIILEESDNESIKEYARAANQSVKRLQDTLNSVINLSNYYAGKQTLHIIPVKLNKLIDKVLEQLRINAELKKLDLVFYDEKMNTAVDWTSFNIILNNIVGNAIKYTDKGNIEIRLCREKRNNINYDCITVSDTGIGIPEEKQLTIFEEFRQGDEGMSRTFQGIGLGLSLVKKLVDMHDGVIELTSCKGKGSCFKIMFPHISFINVKDSITETISKSAGAGDKAKNSRILIVEKDHASSDIEKILLSDFKDVTFADNGFTAIELAGKNKYDAVLINLNLGIGMPGIEVVREIKKIEGYNRIPFVKYIEFLLDEETKQLIKEEDLQYLPEASGVKELIRLLIDSL